MLVRVLVVVAWLLGSAARVHAETIALLPLDSEKKLEIYGQPVAAEIGRALKAQGYDVVVVGAKMDVPDQAQLIVDGTIKSEKTAVTLSLRIRDPHNGSTLETLPPSTGTLTTIDKLAAEVSGRLVPAVKTQLTALAKAAQPTNPTNPTNPERPITNVTPPRAGLPPLVVAVSGQGPALGLLLDGLAAELPGWAALRQREPRTIDALKLARATAVQSVLAENASVGIAFEVLGFSIENGAVPMARARVRVRVVSAGAIVFERVVRTDTIVGDKGIKEQVLAARVAREVLAITNAQLRRLVGAWR